MTGRTLGRAADRTVARQAATILELRAALDRAHQAAAAVEQARAAAAADAAEWRRRAGRSAALAEEERERRRDLAVKHGWEQAARTDAAALACEILAAITPRHRWRRPAPTAAQRRNWTDGLNQIERKATAGPPAHLLYDAQ